VFRGFENAIHQLVFDGSKLGLEIEKREERIHSGTQLCLYGGLNTEGTI
jgi:hypothetical protein